MKLDCQSIKLFINTDLSDTEKCNGRFYFFIGNCDFSENRNKHMFTEHMLDKHVFEHENKTALCLEDIKTFHTSFVIKQVVFI